MYVQKLKDFFSHHFFRRYVWFYLAIVLTALIAFWSGIQYGQATRPAGKTLTQLFQTNVPSWLESLEPRGKNKSLGDPNAPVKVVEYMDIECPFCQRYAAKVFPRLVENYIKTGKVHYVVKHFPLSKRIHPHATMGAIAAECAANQSKFWKYKSLAMANRRYQSQTLFLALANIANLPDQKEFRRCFKQQKTLGTVREEKQEGINAGVKGTPTVIIGERTIRGVRPYTRYKEAIEEVLSETTEQK